MRTLLLPLSAIVGLVMIALPPAQAQVQFSLGIQAPGVSIGLNLPSYPNLVPVPGYPVYYAPQADANYFFYDGLYWVFQGDDWYASNWYNGPWRAVERDAVPVYVLRVPVRYYRQPPAFFRGWKRDAPPRWDQHWGGDWNQRHAGWDRWDRRGAPAPAPLPTYQRRYGGDRYPGAQDQQRELHDRQYRYQPRDPVVRQQFEPRRGMEQRPGPEPRGEPQRPDRGPRDNGRQGDDQRDNDHRGRPDDGPPGKGPDRRKDK